MADTLSILSIVSFSVAGAGFVAAVVMWFVFGIPSVISDLSGKTAKRSIAKMRESNDSKTKTHQSSKTNINRGPLTDNMTIKSGKKSSTAEIVEKSELPGSNNQPDTGLLNENQASSFSESTVLLNDTEETSFLGEVPEMQITGSANKNLTIIEEIIVVHTDESI